MAYRKIELSELLPADIIVTTDKESPISATIKKLRFLLFILVLSFVLSGCSPINKWRSRTPIRVSDTIEIGPEWIEMIPTETLYVRQGTLMELRIYISNLDPLYSSAKWDSIKLKNGKIIKLEGVLIDNLDNEYKLYPCCNNVSYYILSNGQLSNSGVFPVGKYVKLKLRSEEHVKVEKIEWIGSYSIDNMF